MATAKNLEAAILEATRIAHLWAKAGKNSDWPTWDGDLTEGDGEFIRAAYGEGSPSRAEWRAIETAFAAAYNSYGE